jgi:hypothetical protein
LQRIGPVKTDIPLKSPKKEIALSSSLPARTAAKPSLRNRVYRYVILSDCGSISAGRHRSDLDSARKAGQKIEAMAQSRETLPLCVPRLRPVAKVPECARPPAQQLPKFSGFGRFRANLNFERCCAGGRAHSGHKKPATSEQ